MKKSVLALLFFIPAFSVLFIFQQNKIVKERETPNDWFFRQRAYPYKTINQSVYKNEIKKALKQRKEFQNRESIWEFEGPTNIEGRITDVELLPGNPETVFIGAASGGIFKSLDSGNTWQSIFDDSPSLSIGDIVISESNPDIIYVGTGEANAGGGSLAYDGLGVFKSNNGGDTWQYAGLENCGSIGRMTVNPNNPDIVYVAAMGRLFDNSSNGGVYKTVDGGQSWQQILFISDSTGAIDIVLNPQHPDTVYAAMWERVRRPNRRQYGGITSGIYRSGDGGETWTELTNGLPSGASEKGRIGIDICKSNPNILYAVYADKTGYFKGIYRTENNGESWIKKDNGIDNNAYASYGWWFGRIKADPQDANIAYLIGFILYKTNNGGNYWNESTGWLVHVDQHALAIDPANNNKLYLGNDGGFYKSLNGGSTWSKTPNLPITQFYTCEVDEQHPERIYGGAQDNGTNRTLTGMQNDWSQIFGGDGLRVLVDPLNNNYVYAEYQYGQIARSTNGGDDFILSLNGISGTDRFNWFCPFVIDPVNPSILYFGSNRLYKSVNRAASWSPISNDLTNGNESGNLPYNTLTSISVSPLNNNIIYTGSDDGNINVTLNGGNLWTNISGSLPKRWVTSVVADPFFENRVYATFSGYRWDEYQAHVFRSDNNGSSWEDISANLPEVPVNEIVIDPLKTGFLYVATDAGIYASENNGNSWFPVNGGIPVLVVTDLRLHNPTRRLYVATYGRGIYSLDLNILTDVNKNTIGKLAQIKCYPNPFTDIVNIDLSGFKEIVKVSVLDISGKIIKILNTTNVNSNRIVTWDGTNFKGNKVSSGIYLIQTTSNGKKFTSKVLLSQ